jgi:hypothetical protein
MWNVALIQSVPQQTFGASCSPAERSEIRRVVIAFADAIAEV